MVVTPLIRCPRGGVVLGVTTNHAVFRKGFCSQLATNFMMFFARPTATFLLLTVSRSRCSCVLSKARGSHVQIVIQTTPDLCSLLAVVRKASFRLR